MDLHGSTLNVIKDMYMCYCSCGIPQGGSFGAQCNTFFVSYPYHMLSFMPTLAPMMPTYFYYPEVRSTHPETPSYFCHMTHRQDIPDVVNI